MSSINIFAAVSQPFRSKDLRGRLACLHGLIREGGNYLAEGWSQSPDTGCWEWVGVKEEESTGASSAVADCSTSHGAAAAAPPAAIAGKVASSSAEEDGLACRSGGGTFWRRSRGSAACGGSSGLIHVREAPARGMKSLEEERRCEASKG